jgi:tRNA(Ile)-lysidine synthase TilS/MesJ
MNRCKKCILPETFPGIRFNEEGVCNFCLEFTGFDHLEDKMAEYKAKFIKLIDACKGDGDYDVLMSYSGGKDSTYTSIILKNEYKLNVLAVTFDNGFISEQALRNIRTLVENLGIDHISVKPRFDILRTIFRECTKGNIFSSKALERASVICTSCMGLVKYHALRMAVEKNIPFIAYGWSPGQAPMASSIMKNNPQMTKMMQKSIYDPLYRIVGEAINPYFLQEEHFSGSHPFPYSINPLAFLGYDEDKIYETIQKYGWKAPQDTDANSSNCLLNSYANIVHKKQFHFHPYSLELANLVREGYLDRKLALERIDEIEDLEVVGSVRRKLGIE